MGTDEFNTGGKPVMDSHHIQSEIEILLVALMPRALWATLGSSSEFITIALLTFLFLIVLQSLRIIQWSLIHLTWRLISMVSFNVFSYIPIHSF